MKYLQKHFILLSITTLLLMNSCHTYVDVPIGHGPVRGGVSIQTRDPGVAALTLLGVLIGSAIIYGEGEKAPVNCSVSLHINPGHASVFVDGVYIGMADEYNGKPNRLSVTEGKHSLLFKAKGYKDYETEINMRNGMRATVTKTMSKSIKVDSNTENGTIIGLFPQLKLIIDVEPGDAEISIDGKLLGYAKELKKLHGPLIVDGNSKKMTISYKTEHEIYDLQKLSKQQGETIKIKLHYTNDIYE